MKTKSMRECINGDVIANEIRMIRRRMSNCCYLIVEGESDYKLFKRFIKDKCEIKFVNGKDNVIQAINSLNATKTPGILGIVDSDFSQIMKPKVNKNNLLETDTHDIETMIIKSQTLEDFLIEYTNKKKLEDFVNLKSDDFRNVILKVGSTIGYLRYISIKDDLDLKFDEIEYNKFINYHCFNIDEDNLVREVISNTVGCNITCEEIKLKLNKLKSQSMDLWQVCCGHDLTQLISICFNNILKGYKNGELTSKDVEKILRLAYQYRYFINTKLHKSIKEWEIKNTPYSIFYNYEEIQSLTS